MYWIFCLVLSNFKSATILVQNLTSKMQRLIIALLNTVKLEYFAGICSHRVGQTIVGNLIFFSWITPVPWSNKKWTWRPMERAGIGDTRATPHNGKPNICQLSFISLLQSESWASGTKSTKHIKSVCVWFHMVLERPSFIESYPEEKSTLRPVCTTQKV